MKTEVMLGLDQSTSGSKAVLVNKEGEIIAKESMAHEQFYPAPGWVEHSPMELYNNSLMLINSMIDRSHELEYSIKGLSITNQRETVLLWDRLSGLPLCNALVWQCRRGIGICEELKSQGYEQMIEEKTGLKLDTYFSASKIKWALDNEPSVKLAADEERLCVGTVDSWLIFKLTGGRVFATDFTNASRTMLFNIHNKVWDQQLLKLFGLKEVMLAEIRSSDALFGIVDAVLLPSWQQENQCLISGVIGDSQGALFGQQCFEVGMAKATYGTGSSVMVYTGNKKINSDHGLVTSVAWSYKGEVKYALEGIINSSGDTLKWVKDNLGLYQEDREVDELVLSLESNEGVYIVPAFVGLGAPYWRPKAKASIVGLSRKSGKAHIVRAAVESMAYQVNDLLHMMAMESGLDIPVLNVDGGPTQNIFLMQLQADLLGIPIQSSKLQELSVMGAIYLGGLQLGYWGDFDELKSLKRLANQFKAKASKSEVHALKDGWKKAIDSIL